MVDQVVSGPLLVRTTDLLKRIKDEPQLANRAAKGGKRHDAIFRSAVRTVRLSGLFAAAALDRVIVYLVPYPPLTSSSATAVIFIIRTAPAAAIIFIVK